MFKLKETKLYSAHNTIASICSSTSQQFAAQGVSLIIDNVNNYHFLCKGNDVDVFKPWICNDINVFALLNRSYSHLQIPHSDRFIAIREVLSAFKGWNSYSWFWFTLWEETVNTGIRQRLMRIRDMKMNVTYFLMPSNYPIYIITNILAFR